IFPETIDRAKVEFETALDLYDQSKDNDTPEPTRQAVAQEGSQKAMQAQTLADKATDLFAQVSAWDNRIESKEENEKSTAELASLQQKVAMLDEQARAQAMNEQNRSQFQANIKSPVVFFATNRTEVQGKFDENVESLAMTLKNNPSMKVTLIGYADKTGRDSRNNTLSEQRAESVARILRDRGVAAEQILIDSHGSSLASANPSNPAGLQLDRRVDAIISGRSGPETMTTGR
ncbi:MAG: OmpA family protein, partial [Proteobacteria bacterium]